MELNKWWIRKPFPVRFTLVSSFWPFIARNLIINKTDKDHKSWFNERIFERVEFYFFFRIQSPRNFPSIAKSTSKVRISVDLKITSSVLEAVFFIVKTIDVANTMVELLMNSWRTNKIDRIGRLDACDENRDHCYRYVYLISRSSFEVRNGHMAHCI